MEYGPPPKVVSMKDSGNTTNRTGEEPSSMQEDPHTLVTSRTSSSTAEVRRTSPTETSTLDNTSRESRMDTVNINGRTETYMREIS